MKRGTAKKQTVPSSLSCDDKLAEAGDADCYAVVGGSQPATPSVTPGEDLHHRKVLNTPPAPAGDTPISDTNAYASIDIVSDQVACLSVFLSVCLSDCLSICSVLSLSS